jgi:hypothetical protein
MTANTFEVIQYKNFIPQKDLFHFECDMEEGLYRHWVVQYPNHAFAIFAALITFYGDLITEEDVIYFVNMGINLNVITDAFPSEYGFTSAIIFACENGFKYLVQYLIKYGADVNLKNLNGISPLESVLMGYHKNLTKECVEILLESGANNRVKKSVMENYRNKYGQSLYLKTVLNVYC